MNPALGRRGERCYVYRSWWLRSLAGAADAAGWLLVRILTLGRGLRPDPDRWKNPKRILAVRLDHIGDVLFLRPALQALRAHFPSSRITVLVSSAGGELLARDPWVDEILVWNAPWFARGPRPSPQPGFFALARKLRAGRFDLALDFRGDIRHILLLWLARVRVRVGYGITGGGFLLHCCLKLPVSRHEVERNLAVVAAVGAGDAPRSYSPLPLNKEDQQAGASAWQGAGPGIVIHPLAGDPAKRWPAGHCAQVCDALQQAGCEVLLVGTAGEKDRIREVVRLCAHPPRNAAGAYSLRALAAVLSRARLLIGTDSGPAHLALTQGIPVVMLWSETNAPGEWGPWGQNARAAVIRRPWRPEAVAEIIRAAGELLEIKLIN